MFWFVFDLELGIDLYWFLSTYQKLPLFSKLAKMKQKKNAIEKNESNWKTKKNAKNRVKWMKSLQTVERTNVRIIKMHPNEWRRNEHNMLNNFMHWNKHTENYMHVVFVWLIHSLSCCLTSSCCVPCKAISLFRSIATFFCTERWKQRRQRRRLSSREMNLNWSFMLKNVCKHTHTSTWNLRARFSRTSE